MYLPNLTYEIILFEKLQNYWYIYSKRNCLFEDLQWKANRSMFEELGKKKKKKELKKKEKRKNEAGGSREMSAPPSPKAKSLDDQ